MKKETRALLKMRAVAMAEDQELKSESSESIEIITFTLAYETYGIESAYIREVYPLKDFTPLPGVPVYILGIINVRGHILPVVDLKKFFNLPENGLGELNKVIIIYNEVMEFGFLADVVHGRQSVKIDEIMAVPSAISGIGEVYLKGVAKENLILLNAKKLLTDKGIVVNEEVM